MRNGLFLGRYMAIFVVFLMSSCGTVSSSDTPLVDETGQSVDVIEVVRDITIIANVALSDGSSITAETADVFKYTSSGGLVTQSVSIQNGQLSVSGLFESLGDYALSIRLEQGTKQFVWDVGTVNVTQLVHINFGDVEMAEYGVFIVLATFDQVYFSYGFDVSVVGRSRAFHSIIDTNSN
ncbi:MAG: hypothetical protein O3A01_07125, partial [bacterium]|nr:hypothetical protein [bacterium]